MLFTGCEISSGLPAAPDADSAGELDELTGADPGDADVLLDDELAPPDLAELDLTDLDPADVDLDGDDAVDTLDEDSVGEADSFDDADDLEADGTDWVPECTSPPCPIVIDTLPFHDRNDTSAAPSRFDAYACSPSTNEAGPERVYVLRLDEPGTLIAGVEDDSDVDIDIHLLASLDANDCLRRSDLAVSAPLEAGVYYLVADTWVDGSGVAQTGAYDLHVWFLPDAGPCGLRAEQLARIGTADLLAMPATGKVVKEAHLLTQEEHEANVAAGMATFPTGWPESFTDHIAEHYAASAAVSGFEAARSEPWAPCCEPSNEYGQGSTAKPPLAAEAWYLNMRWASAPPRGERYLVFDYRDGQAVVAAAGYENGPGDLSRIGGTAEEVHLYLGSAHLSTLTFGALRDQGVAYGPMSCFP